MNTANGNANSKMQITNNLLTQVQNYINGGVISQYDYVNDAAGRRTAITRSGSMMSETRTDCYDYNYRSELIYSRRGAETAEEYAYQYDDIGNRLSSLDLGTNSTYTANALNQYTQISNLAASVSLREEFVPQFDDDGNQTLVKTATGTWSVTYNGENRPILWSNPSNISHPSNVSNLISLSFDRMGRRVTKNDQRFVYNGYLQIADNAGNVYVWDPSEPVATRPLVWNRGDSGVYYAFDGNKNVSEVIASDGSLTAHYEYAPFGAVTTQTGALASVNPFRFSSEFAEDDLSLAYYNYRHYEPVTGRWGVRDLIWERGGRHLYAYCINRPSNMCDRLGLYSSVGIETHQNILEHALNSLLEEGGAPCLKNDAALKEYVLTVLKQANADMDGGDYAADDNLHLHFNRKMGVESNEDIKKVIHKYREGLEKRRSAASSLSKKGLCYAALKNLGELTHMTQDYWGHGVSYEYKGKAETLYYREHGEKYPIGEVTVYPSDDVIGESTGDPDNPLMKPSNYNGHFGNSEHGSLLGREPGNRAPDGTGLLTPPLLWKYDRGRLGKAVDYTKQDLRLILGEWCKSCCDFLNRSNSGHSPTYYGPIPTMSEVVEALNSLNW